MFYLNERIYGTEKLDGAWPSGKAAGFDPVIRRFESFRPRKNIREIRQH